MIVFLKIALFIVDFILIFHIKPSLKTFLFIINKI